MSAIGYKSADGKDATLDSAPIEWNYSDWDAVGALVLVGALVFALFWSLHDNREVEGRFATRNAMAMLSEGRYSEAAELLERTLPLYAPPDTRLALSYAYLARLDGERAERQARLAVEAAPPDLRPAALAQLGRVLSFNGKEEDALHAWRVAIESAAPYPDFERIRAEARSALWHTAISHWVRGDFDTARRDLESLIGPNDIYSASAQIKLAQLDSPGSKAQSPKSSQGAFGLWALDLGLPPAIPNLRVPGLREGLSPEAVTRIAGELEQARADAEKARAEGASEAGIAALWGRAFLAQNEPHLAKLYLEQALALQPGVSDFHSYMALALLDKGDEQGALSHLNEAVKLAADRPLPRHVLVRLYMGRKEWDRASEQLSVLKRLEPGSVQVSLQLGDYYTLRSAYEQAEEAYIAAVMEQRKPGKGVEPDAALSLARFYSDVRGMGCDKGLPVAQESLSNHKGDPASLDAVGWALVLCKQAEEALSTLEAAVEAAPDVARYRYHLARAYAGLDRPEDARAQYRRAMDLDPGGQWEQLAINGLTELPAAAEASDR